jgi:phage terminase small subunit
MSTLTAKQRRFVEEYLIDKNATQAAIRAGYSKKTAANIGYENVRKPEIAAEIESGLASLSEKTGITAERVIRELGKLAFVDMRRLFTDTGQLVSVTELDDDTAAALSSVEVVTRLVPGSENEDGLKDVEHIHKIKVWDKRAALVDLGKHLGLFPTNVELTGKDGGPVQFKDVSAMTDDAIDAELRQILGGINAANVHPAPEGEH